MRKRAVILATYSLKTIEAGIESLFLRNLDLLTKDRSLAFNVDLTILLLALFALIFAYLLIRRRKRGRYKLERDKTGLWRYHKDSHFERKIAYEIRLSKSKDEKKEAKKHVSEKAVAVVNFLGDIRAKQHRSLAQIIDEVEINKDSLCEVVVVVSSPGGMVAQYGHAYSQLERVRALGLELTVCIDVVAASGGYLMSVPANKIIAAPFAMVGSVGVMAFVPNVRNALTRLNIDPRTFTAGKYKRTVSLFDNATPEEVEHFQGQLEEIHERFIGTVRKYRPDAAFDHIETGDHWTAAESVEKELGLVDQIGTSEDYLLKRNRETDLVLISQKRSFWEDGIGIFSSSVADQIESRVFRTGTYW